MKCQRCKKTSKEALCNHCFIHVFEKRVNKELRTKHLFKKGERVLVLDDISYHILSQRPLDLTDKRMVKAWSRKPLPRTDQRTAVPLTANMLAETILEKLFTCKSVKRPINQIPILATVTTDQALRYAKLKNLKFKVQRDKISIFLNKLEETIPGTSFSMLHSKL